MRTAAMKVLISLLTLSSRKLALVLTNAYTSNTLPSSECSTSSLGDGFCDEAFNNAECDYDGGDCCSCTCVGSSVYSCGSFDYDCRDPHAGCQYPDCGGWIEFIGDGYCDDSNNNADCYYDGGDCCACTCVDSNYTCGTADYDCQDPFSDCATSSQIVSDYPNCAGSASLIGNGDCDSLNNNANCDFDGGDCCACTCVDSTYTCGINEYDCQDPSSECETPSPLANEYPDCGGRVSLIGNGYCTYFNNNADCGYDGGDCCSCTCIDGDFTCGLGGYDCQDPSAACPMPSPAPGIGSTPGELRRIEAYDDDNDNDDSDSKSLSVLVLSGIVGGGVIVLVAVVLGVFYALRRPKAQEGPRYSESERNRQQGISANVLVMGHGQPVAFASTGTTAVLPHSQAYNHTAASERPPPFNPDAVSSTP